MNKLASTILVSVLIGAVLAFRHELKSSHSKVSVDVGGNVINTVHEQTSASGLHIDEQLEDNGTGALLGSSSKAAGHNESRNGSQGPRRKIAFVIGATGLLGREVMKAFRPPVRNPEWDVFGTSSKPGCDQNQDWHARFGTNLIYLNFNDPPARYQETLRRVILSGQLTVVINLAANRQAGACERMEDEDLYKINVAPSKKIAEYCKEANVHMIHVSTNYVFKERSPEPISEGADPGNDGAGKYGWSKLQAEKAVVQANPQASIVRLPLLYGLAEKWESAIDFTVLGGLKKWREKYDDQKINKKTPDGDAMVKAIGPCYMCRWQQRFPAYTKDVAQVLLRFADVTVASGKSHVYYHWQGAEMLTAYEMARRILSMPQNFKNKHDFLKNFPDRYLQPDDSSKEHLGKPKYESMSCQRMYDAILGNETFQPHSFSESLSPTEQGKLGKFFTKFDVAYNKVGTGFGTKKPYPLWA